MTKYISKSERAVRKLMVRCFAVALFALIAGVGLGSVYTYSYMVNHYGSERYEMEQILENALMACDANRDYTLGAGWGEEL